MSKKFQNILIYSFFIYVVIGVFVAILSRDSQLVPIPWGEYISNLPWTFGSILFSFLFHYIVPVLLWPFGLIIFF